MKHKNKIKWCILIKQNENQNKPKKKCKNLEINIYRLCKNFNSSYSLSLSCI